MKTSISIQQIQGVEGHNAGTSIDSASPAAAEQVLAVVLQQEGEATVAAVATLAQALLPALIEQATTWQQQQPLIDILNTHKVLLDDNNIEQSLENLQSLKQALLACPLWNAGRSPGFFTRQDDSSGRTWSLAPTLACYETMDFYPSDRYSMPVPSAAFAWKCCDFIEQVLRARLQWTTRDEDSSSDVCSCIASWHHCHNVLYTLVNQALEQLMAEEASDCVTSIVQNSEVDWNQTYAPDGCPPPEQLEQLYIPSTPIRLLRNRDDFVATVTKFCLAAESTIEISTCYLFGHDPAQRYLLMDLLPYVVQKHGVTVRLLLDLMTIESAVIKSGFAPTTTCTSKVPPTSTSAPKRITADSFLQHLPHDAPPQSELARQDIVSPLAFLEQLLELASSPANQGLYRVHWWCARDAARKYRVKNHSKSTVVDGKVAIFGGSNLTPTLQAATSDLDAIVTGPAAAQVGYTFELLWTAMEKQEACALVVPSEEKKEDKPSAFSSSSRLAQAIASESWADTNSRVAIIRSEPSSEGDDAILRVILGAIANANTSITMCMGHSNYPRAFCQAVANAAARGVRVRILVNSLYSNDLRSGQRDLFLSLRDLLQIAPEGVEVYTTATASMRGGNNGFSTTDERPPFLHAKYVVIDQEWTAVGSWNLWTRGSFYEIEHEALVQSATIAQELERKFEEECEATAIRLWTAQDCERSEFCPLGCLICRGFGPFFK